MFEFLKKFLTLLVLVMFALWSLGCSTMREPTYIPTKCEVKRIEKPTRGEYASDSVVKILTYTELIEKDLDFCRGE